MIRAKCLKLGRVYRVVKWVEYDGSSRGVSSKTGKSHGRPHNCYRGVIKCDGVKIRRRFPTYVAARAWVENWHRYVE